MRVSTSHGKLEIMQNYNVASSSLQDSR